MTSMPCKHHGLTNKQPYNETALLELLQSDKEAGFQLLYDRFAPTFLSFIIKTVHNQQEAEDLLQESFIKIWHNLDKFDPNKGRLFTWMSTIVRNTTFRSLRYRVCYSSVDLIDPEFLPHVTPTIQTIGLMPWIQSILNVSEWYMIHLVYFQGYTFQQITDEFGYPLGTVKTIVRRALRKLRENT